MGLLFDRNGSQAPPHRSRPGIDKIAKTTLSTRARGIVGRIYETRGGPEHLRWFWSFAVQGSDDALGSRRDL
jgi:hypothetical protein